MDEHLNKNNIHHRFLRMLNDRNNDVVDDEMKNIIPNQLLNKNSM